MRPAPPPSAPPGASRLPAGHDGVLNDGTLAPALVAASTQAPRKQAQSIHPRTYARIRPLSALLCCPPPRLAPPASPLANMASRGPPGQVHGQGAAAARQNARIRGPASIQSTSASLGDVPQPLRRSRATLRGGGAAYCGRTSRKFGSTRKKDEWLQAQNLEPFFKGSKAAFEKWWAVGAAGSGQRRAQPRTAESARSVPPPIPRGSLGNFGLPQSSCRVCGRRAPSTGACRAATHHRDAGERVAREDGGSGSASGGQDILHRPALSAKVLPLPRRILGHKGPILTRGVLRLVHHAQHTAASAALNLAVRMRQFAHTPVALD